jgi:hypothetical protein
MLQTSLTFPTSSPINIERMKGQNKKLYDWLTAGNKIHCFHPAMSTLGIGYLNSRISDLKKAGVCIESKFITIKDNGEDVSVKEYSIKND